MDLGFAEMMLNFVPGVIIGWALLFRTLQWKPLIISSLAAIIIYFIIFIIWNLWLNATDAQVTGWMFKRSSFTDRGLFMLASNWVVSIISMTNNRKRIIREMHGHFD